uniref:Uncharacterized protein n=1 Tax=Myoviridae sp. ctdWz11 TaxID=2826671 RepID=A0A8S5NQP8_9CAUD|nr:MAG TPA: hypothetical protein [Myoviridae sp. ctdWz11]
MNDTKRAKSIENTGFEVTKEIIGYDFSIKYFKSHGKSTVFRGFFYIAIP